jgi:RNA polymerase sigma factor (sigma-70 family)
MERGANDLPMGECEEVVTGTEGERGEPACRKDRNDAHDLVQTLFGDEGRRVAASTVRRRLFWRPELGASEADDFLQDTFLRLLVRLRRVGSHLRDPMAYMAVCAARTISDHVRSRRRQSRIRDAVAQASAATCTFDEDSSISDPVARACVNAYLSALPPELGAVYRERYVVQRSERDAAAVLGLSYGSFRLLERRLLEGLRSKLQLKRTGRRHRTKK